MANFTQLKALQVTSANTKSFDLPEVGPEAKLELCCSNEGNSGYMNGLLRLTGQLNRHNVAAIGLNGKQCTGFHGFSIQHHRTSSAVAGVTTDMGPGQA